MKIILIKDIPKIGRKGDIKDVSEGYAINFAIPRKLALFATKENIKRVELMKETLEVSKKVQDSLLIKIINDLSQKQISIKAKANEKGHLFAGITKEDIVSVIKSDLKVSIDPDFISLDKPIKEVGNYVIEIITPNKAGKIKLEVFGE